VKEKKTPLLNVFVPSALLVKIAPKKLALIIAQNKEHVLKELVYVMMALKVLTVLKKPVKVTVVAMENVIALLEPVYVIKTSGVQTVQKKDVTMIAMVMDNVLMVCVSVMQVSLVKIAKKENVLLIVEKMENVIKDSVNVKMDFQDLDVIKRNAPLIVIIEDYVIMELAFV
jgi:hypothetical protein